MGENTLVRLTTAWGRFRTAQGRRERGETDVSCLPARQKPPKKVHRKGYKLKNRNVNILRRLTARQVFSQFDTPDKTVRLPPG
jgi:hypothetical protein